MARVIFCKIGKLIGEKVLGFVQHCVIARDLVVMHSLRFWSVFHFVHTMCMYDLVS